MGYQFLSSHSFAANGSIEPSVFVVGSNADNRVVQSNATGVPIGVSGDMTNRAPRSTNSGTEYHATAGQSAQVHGLGQLCKIKLGTGGCSAFSKLKPDANGYGVATTTTGDKYYFVAFEAGAVGEFVFGQFVGLAIV